MKEEAPSSKKMPRKPRMPSAPLAPTTPTKMGNDEILSALLRLNNFDSSIKDESLDIDLSACVTISADSAPMLGGANSLSSDFWRVLDESAQTAQLDLALATSCSSDALDDINVTAFHLAGGIIAGVGSGGGSRSQSAIGSNNICAEEEAGTVGVIVKQEQQNTFSGTFLRPEMPAPSQSPLKRLFMRTSAAEQPRLADNTEIREQKIRRDFIKKINNVDQVRGLSGGNVHEDAAFDCVSASTSSVSPVVRSPTNNGVIKNKTISSSSFNIFMLPDRKTPIPPPPPTSGNNSGGIVPTSKPATSTTNHEAGAVATAEEVANSAEPLFKCLDCQGLLLHGRHEYNTHEAVGHRIHYRCTICERDFEQEAGLKKHIKTHRSVDARKDAWKKCPDCGKCLKLGSMWMHRKIHSDNKKYGCDICGQKFVQKINLTHHSRIHTAEKPYECPECQKRFQERSHLQRHQKYHAQTRSYRCDKCGKMYKTERCLKVHNLVHLEQRPFACNVCEKSFISNSKLKQHSNIHTGERPFKCNYCPRDFTNFPNWLKHTRRRHKVDHKTGEHLENIPSYCSKKSTKAKQPKASEANTDAVQQASSSTAQSDEPVGAVPSGTAATMPKPQAVKRKKKPPLTPTIKLENVEGDGPPVPPLVVSLATTDTVLTLPNTTTIKTISSKPANSGGKKGADIEKTIKPKRERKQVAPKQVQKSIPPVLLPSIKREITEPSITLKGAGTMSSLSVDTRCALSNFPDLSITSAEELIMEQALEMEECCLYVTPPSAVLDTDNAISSSEAAAAHHFKIKSEFDPMDLSPPRIKEEEFIPLKDMNQRLLCSSLESSPYSSPASIELTTNPSLVAVQPNTTANNCIPQTTTTFYMPSFSLNTQNVNLVTSLNHSLSSATTADFQQLLPQSVSHLPPGTTTTLPATQAIINRFYLHPITAMGMPLLAQPTNQKLPSVDTLLFSTSASTSTATISNSGNFFRSKNVAEQTTTMASTNTTVPPQHKLS